VSGDRLVSDERRFPDVVVVQPGSGLLRYNGKLYRGWLEIRKAAANRIKIINHVGIDDYLNGVLPFEALANWKTETLKAQAVVCRTYAIASLRRHGTQGYDVCALTHCQVYHGASGEDPRTSRAVSETTGQIMTYKGYPIAAYFHDDCGGMTESAEDVWSGEKGHFPYLRRVRCPSIMSWKAVISRQDLAAAVSSPKLEASEITNFRVSSRTPSGRARMVAISTRRHGTISFSANALRLRLGADRIRSTFWRHIQRRRSGWEISGTGWGHGVGLCQLGAERLGEKGWSCREILEHYFKGIRIEHGIE
jgi:stage II sporulation protein D